MMEWDKIMLFMLWVILQFLRLSYTSLNREDCISTYHPVLSRLYSPALAALLLSLFSSSLTPRQCGG